MSDQGLATRRATGLAGLGVAVLFGAGNALWAFDQPDAGTPVREIVAFYTDTSARIIVGGSLSLLSIALFVVFASGVRTILREHEGDDLLATTAFGGALLLVAAGLGAETRNMVGAWRAEDGQFTPELGRALFEISYVLGYNGAGVGIGILLLAIAAVALRDRAPGRSCVAGSRSPCSSSDWRSSLHSLDSCLDPRFCCWPWCLYSSSGFRCRTRRVTSKDFADEGCLGLGVALIGFASRPGTAVLPT